VTGGYFLIEPRRASSNRPNRVKLYGADRELEFQFFLL